MAKKETKEQDTARDAQGGGRPRAKGDNGDGDVVDFATVRALARIATEFDLEEIEVDGDGHVRVRRASLARPARAARRAGGRRRRGPSR